MLSGEVPRAVRRAGRAGAPSTSGGLGNLAAERLMDLGRTGSIFLVCSSRVSFSLVSGDLRANAGMSRKLPFDFII